MTHSDFLAPTQLKVPLVGLGLDVALFKGIAQVLLGRLEVVVKHVLATHVVLVRHLLDSSYPLQYSLKK